MVTVRWAGGARWPARRRQSPGRLKVFISYSRKDEDFAQDLLAGLQAAGFEPYLDNHAITACEDWEATLGRLIEGADTVVFVISPFPRRLRPMRMGGIAITFVSNIPGETQTLPSTIYTFTQVRGGDVGAFRLTLVSFAIAMLALLVSELMARHANRRLDME